MKISRREFVRKAAATSALLSFPTILPRHVYGGNGYTPPSEKVYIGLIGAGGQGRHDTQGLLPLKNAQVVSIADPSDFWNLESFYYKSHAGRSPVKKMVEDHYRDQGLHSNVSTYSNFETMLEKEKHIDAVLCATPDHTHAYVTAYAMRAGKHVYCEKPLTHNLWENRQIAKIAKETGVMTQMGNMGHSKEGIRRTVELVRSGLIGEIKEVSSWGFAARFNKTLSGIPSSTDPIPEGFDWNLWLGPREYVPYNHLYTPVVWRDFWKYGTGALGDFGCHDMDAPVWAFDLEVPERVKVYPGGFSIGQWHKDITPYSEIGYFRFKAKGQQKAVDLNWYSGGVRPRKPDCMPERYELPQRGVMFYGANGVIQTDGAGSAPKVFPRELREEAKKVPNTLPRSKGHFKDWVDSVVTGKPASANFEYASRLNEIVLLGVLSLRLEGAVIKWDSENLKAIGLPEADPFIKEPIRQGWEI